MKLAFRSGLGGLGLLTIIAIQPVPAGAAEPVKVFAAGSLTMALREIVTAAALPPDEPIAMTFGSAGALRERIEKGEAADLLLSADMAGPKHLAKMGRLVVPPIPFARNAMCVAGKKSLSLTPSTVLERMLDPKMRLAMSTPGADPGGDYALAVFARADTVQPGAAVVLAAKAAHLLGGPTTMVPVGNHTPAASIFLADQADLLLYYCSGAASLSAEVPDVVSVPVPPGLEPRPVYGMALLSPTPGAMRLALFVLSDQGQSILSKYGLKRVLSDPAP